jgi:FkbH-like protein/FkbM family methyltransferase
LDKIVSAEGVMDRAPFEYHFSHFEYFRDHAVADEPLVPGVFVDELLRSSLQLSERSSELRLTKLQWIKPIVPEREGGLRVELDGARFSLQELAGTGRFVQGEYCVTADAEARRSALESVESYLEGSQPLEAADFYARFAERGIRYAGAFRRLERIYHRDDALLIEAPARAHGPFQTSPELLDYGIQGAIFLHMQRAAGALVPAYAGQLHTGGALAERVRWIWVRAGKSDAGPRAYDVDLLDAELRVVGSMRSLVLKPKDGQKPTIVNLSANFTATPLLKYLRFWTERSPGNFEVRESLYNQVVQDLLNPSGPFYAPQSINLLLDNPDDWAGRAAPTLTPVVTEAERATSLAGLGTYQLPDGNVVASLNAYETAYLYDEIFVQHAYGRNSIVIKDGDCVLDIGANIGLFSLYVTSQFPSCRVFAFEPSPVTYKALEANLRIYCRDATPIAAGVGRSEGVGSFTFYRASSVFSGFVADEARDREALDQIVRNQLRQRGVSESELATMSATLLEGRTEREQYDVPLMSISRLIAERAIERVDLLKIDAESSELAILEGIVDADWPKIQQIAIEVHDAANVAAVVSALEARGFDVSSAQERLLENSGLLNVYATRQKAVVPAEPDIVDTFVHALREYDSRSRNPLALVLTASPTASRADARLREAIASAAASLQNVRMVEEPSALLGSYGLDSFDPIGRAVGNVPHTEAYFAALSRLCARMVLESVTPAKKVLVLDADNTLWAGVCGEEDDVERLLVTERHLALQRFALAQKARGVLLCIASKNDEADVLAVLRSHPGMLVREQDIVAFKVNWQPKSSNLRELARDLNLGLDSFVFVDDNAVECAEVGTKLPQVLSLHLPPLADWAAMLESLWVFGAREATGEDATRTSMYREEATRRSLLGSSSSYADFIAALQLEIHVAAVGPDDLARVEQLHARTNQFNFVKRRPARAELEALLASGGDEMFVARVKDRFGDYGTVAAVHLCFREDGAHLESVLLSCRALGKGVEHGLLAFVGARCQERGLETVIVHFEHSRRNEPARRFVETLFGPLPSEPGELRVPVAASTLAACRFEPEAVPGTPVPVPESFDRGGSSSFDASLHESLVSARDPRWLCAQLGESVASLDAAERAFSSVQEYVSWVFARVLRVDPERVDREVDYESLGIGSLDVIGIVRELNKTFGDIPSTVMFEYASVAQLTEFIERTYPDACAGLLARPAVEASTGGDAAATSAADGRLFRDGDIAIVGLAGLYPDAENLDQFWSNLSRGTTSFRDLRDERWSQLGLGADSGIYSFAAATIRTFDLFDPLFFRISPQEAETMDPQQRHFLMNCWALLEDAGYTPEKLGREVGVFCGVMTSSYGLVGNADAKRSRNLDYDHYEIPNRVSYFFDFIGPSLAVDTACSSSLTAVHLACESLRRGECRAAIAGGVHLILHPSRYAQYCGKNMLSREGVCTPFSDAADGFVDGEGVGSVLLKPLAAAIDDGDHIYGVIKASAVAGTGKTRGFTVPSPVAQSLVVSRCLAQSGIAPERVSYVEAHGTGTVLGDPIEIRGLTLAYAAGTEKKQYCAVGSVKSNIGHLESAAGIASLTKVLLQLRHGQLAPTANLRCKNPDIPLEKTPFYVVDVLRDWPAAEAPRIAAVSSFGAGGANAHLLVAEYPQPPRTRRPDATRFRFRFPFSARSTEDLRRLLNRYLEFFTVHSVDPFDLEHTLCLGRRCFSERVVFSCESTSELVEDLRAVLETGWSDPLRPNVMAGSTRAHHNEREVDRGSHTLDPIAARWCHDAKAELSPLNDGGRKISLPTYAFDLQRYWPETLPSPVASSAGELFGPTNESDYRGYRYSFRVRADSAMLREHVVNGEPVVPAAYLVLMLRACGERFFGGPEFTLERVRFIEPIRPDGGDLQLQVSWSVDAAGIHAGVSFQGRQKCSASLRPTARAQAAGSERGGVKGAISAADIEHLYETHRRNGMSYGSSYRRLQAGTVFDERFELRLSDQPESDLRAVTALDCGLHSALLAMDSAAGELWLPIAVDSVTVWDGIDATCRIELSRSAPRNGNLVFDLSYYGAGDELVGLVRGAAFQRVARRAVAQSATADGESRYALRAQALQEVPVATGGLSPLPANAVLWIDVSSKDWHGEDAHPALLLGHRYIEANDGSASFRLSEVPAQQGWSDEQRGWIEEAELIVLAGGEEPVDPADLWMRYVSRVKSVRHARGARPTRFVLVYRDRPDRAGVSWAALEAVNRALEKELGRSSSFSSLACRSVRALVERPELLVAEGNLRVSAEGVRTQRWVDAELPEPLREGRLPLAAEGVYLITGGSGGIARLLAHDILSRSDARVLLVGRRKRTVQELGGLAAFNLRVSRVHYEALDVADPEAMRSFMRRCQSQSLDLRGIFHCAGLLEDAYALNMTRARVLRTVAPKLGGLENLAPFLEQFPIEFVALFSSIASSLGNSGQTNYAFANGALDAWAWRFGAPAQPCKILSINWPFWREGGMSMTADQRRAYHEHFGLRELETAHAMDTLWAALRSEFRQVMPLPVSSDRAAPAPSSLPAESAPDSESDTEQLERRLTQYVCAILKVPEDVVDVTADMGDYGFDSITLASLADSINQGFGLKLNPSIFFDKQSIRQLAEHLLELGAPLSKAPVSHARSSFAGASRDEPRLLPSRVEEGDVAVVGLECIFPGAPSLEDFHALLERNECAIAAVPADRSSLAHFKGGEFLRDGAAVQGGWIQDYDVFDEQFFNISPVEAANMDPQQRLVLQTVWRALEQAGQDPQALKGRKVGVYLGAATHDFDQIRARGGSHDAYLATGSNPSIISNRVSYFLDLRGPSEVVNTACSSSLVALRQAVRDVRDGRCEMAIVGGVNLLLSPRNFELFGKAGMLSPDWRCKTFDADANGYVRGEGVGVAVLKPALQALRDGDDIWAVVRGVAVNHNGKSTSLTAPSTKAQLELLLESYGESGVSLDRVGYLETHGTGTPLGDPIELNAVQQAAEALGCERNEPLSLASVKSNIGHLEAAAGIAGLIKACLAMRHQVKYATANYRNLNPYIKLDDALLRIQEQVEPWVAQANELGQLPRVAAVSSFGYGGVNAHVVLEEFVPPSAPLAAAGLPAEPRSCAFLVSARTTDTLRQLIREYAERIPEWRAGGQSIGALEHALVHGRAQQRARFAVLFEGWDDLASQLARVETLELTEAVPTGQELRFPFEETSNRADLVAAFRAGASVRWATTAARPSFGGLPRYPFAGRRYPVVERAENEAAQHVPSHEPLHALLDENCSTLYEQKFSKRLVGRDWLMAEHRIRGARTLPASAYLEMALQAARRSADGEVLVLRNCAWRRLFELEHEDAELLAWIRVLRDDDATFSVEIVDRGDAEPNFRCEFSLAEESSTHLDRARGGEAGFDRSRSLSHQELYARLEQRGYRHGPAFRVIDALDVAADGRHVLARLRDTPPNAQFLLAPERLDAAFQALLGFFDDDAKAEPYLPYEVGEVALRSGFSAAKLSQFSARLSADLPHANVKKADIFGLDAQGNVCLSLTDVVIKQRARASLSVILEQLSNREISLQNAKQMAGVA